VEVPQPPARGDQGRLAVRPRRPGPAVANGASVEVGQDFPAFVIDTERARRAGEPDGLEVTQQRMDSRRLRASSPADGLTDADCPVVAAAGHPLSHAPGP